MLPQSKISPWDPCSFPSNVLRRKALLIGCCKAASDLPVLIAPATNVIEFRKDLIDSYDFKSDDITVMLDADDLNPEINAIKPTHDNIMDQLRIFTEDPQTWDEYVFLYAGHTTQVYSDDPKERDHLDECIMPCDYDEKGAITDDDLNNYLVKPLGPRMYLLAICDTCHSGTLLDLPHDRCNRVSKINCMLRRSGRKVKETIFGARSHLPLLGKRLQYNHRRFPRVSGIGSENQRDGERGRPASVHSGGTLPRVASPEQFFEPERPSQSSDPGNRSRTVWTVANHSKSSTLLPPPERSQTSPSPSSSITEGTPLLPKHHDLRGNVSKRPLLHPIRRGTLMAVRKISSSAKTAYGGIKYAVEEVVECCTGRCIRQNTLDGPYGLCFSACKDGQVAADESSLTTAFMATLKSGHGLTLKVIMKNLSLSACQTVKDYNRNYKGYKKDCIQYRKHNRQKKGETPWSRPFYSIADAIMYRLGVPLIDDKDAKIEKPKFVIVPEPQLSSLQPLWMNHEFFI